MCETALSEPFDVRVAAGEAVAAEPEAAAMVTPTDAMAIETALDDEAPRPVSAYPAVLIFLALGPLAAIGAWIARRPKRVRPAPTPAQRLGAIGGSADSDSIRSVRRALVDGLQLRTGLDRDTRGATSP